MTLFIMILVNIILAIIIYKVIKYKNTTYDTKIIQVLKNTEGINLLKNVPEFTSDEIDLVLYTKLVWGKPVSKELKLHHNNYDDGDLF